MTDRKPDLRRYQPLEPEDESEFILASDLPTAILNATKEELAALAVFAEAMPELLDWWDIPEPGSRSLVGTMNAAYKAAKSTTAEEGK